MEVRFRSALKNDEKGLISSLVNTVTEGRVKYKYINENTVILHTILTGVSVSGGSRYTGPSRFFSNDRFADCFEEVLFKVLPDLHKLSEIENIIAGIEGEFLTGDRKKLEEGLYEPGDNQGYSG